MVMWGEFFFVEDYGRYFLFNTKNTEHTLSIQMSPTLVMSIL